MSNAPAAAHALDVLEHLSRHAEPVPAASIARDLGLPRSSVYHLLKVLHARGYVTHYVEERRFGLGQAAYELGSAYQRQAPLARVARAAMRRLVDQCGRNAHFATLDGRDVIYLLEERAAGPADARHRRRGAPARPPHGERARDAVRPARRARCGRSIPTARASCSATAPARPRSRSSAPCSPRCAAGHAREEGTVTPDLSSVAVAVIDRASRPLAAIAVTCGQRRDATRSPAARTGRRRPPRSPAGSARSR